MLVLPMLFGAFQPLKHEKVVELGIDRANEVEST
jgi:hypothetical protein